MFGAIPKPSPYTGWGGDWGQGYNWHCYMCGAPGGNHPRCVCKGLSCDCPELPRLASAGDTIITPPLLNHGHYSKGNVPNMLQQSFCWAGWARFNLLRCWIFPAALEAPCAAMGANTGSKAVCSQEHQDWLSGETLWAAPAQPFCKGLRETKPVIEKEVSGFVSSLRSCEDMVVLTGQVEVNSLHQIYTKWHGEVLRWST